MDLGEVQSIAGLRCCVDVSSERVDAIERLLRRAHEESLDGPGRITRITQAFLGTPFQFETRLPPVPDDCVRVCLTSFDCITLIYHVLALSGARTFPEYVQRLADLRYVHGSKGPISNDPVDGTFYDFACEALLENAIRRGFLADVTDHVAGAVRLMPVRIKLEPFDRPKEHDQQQTCVVPRHGTRHILANFIPASRIAGIEADRVRSGDIILFSLGAFEKDGRPRHTLIRHAAIALRSGLDIHFIHASKDFYVRSDNRESCELRASGVFIGGDSAKEQIGVGLAGAYAGDAMTTEIAGVRYFGYYQERARSLANYAAENFVGLKILRVL